MDDDNFLDDQDQDTEDAKPEESDNETGVVPPMSYTTRQPAPLGADVPFDASMRLEEPVDTISILIPGNEKPTVIRNRNKALIGRRDESIGFFPDIDLTANYGVLMGISRKHAELTLKDGQCFVTDLHSSNGSWLNEIKMVPGNTYPIHNGDQLRLGQLLILVYLSSSKDGSQASVPPSHDIGGVMTIEIADLTGTSRLLAAGMAPSYMVDTIGVYLRAMAAVQRIVRDAQEEKAEPVMVRRIELQEARRIVQIDLINASDIASFLHGKLPHYIAQREQKLSTAQLVGTERQEIPTSTGDLAKDIAEYMLSELVIKFLQSKRESYVERLSKVLLPILKSNLKIIAAWHAG